eukprot:2650095-Rhodomonas_salina.2
MKPHSECLDANTTERQDAILETASWRAKPPNSDEAFRAGLFERYLTPEMVRYNARAMSVCVRKFDTEKTRRSKILSGRERQTVDVIQIVGS